MPLQAAEHPLFRRIRLRLLSTCQLGNVAAHTELDVRKTANNQLFWEGVREPFEGQDKA